MPYSHQAVVADPAYCRVKYEYTIPTLINGNSPVSRTDTEFTIYYDQDLTPLDETITVSVTAISDSKYATSAGTPVEKTGTFTVNFDNPCIDQAFVVI